jgi:hypothetical protein
MQQFHTFQLAPGRELSSVVELLEFSITLTLVKQLTLPFYGLEDLATKDVVWIR